MKYLVLTKEFFPDFTLPEHPTKLDRLIQRIVDMDGNVVRANRTQVRTLLRHFMHRCDIEGISKISNRIVRNPAKHMLWMLISADLRSFLYKKLVYLNATENNIFFDFKPEVISIYPERFGTLEQWTLYNFFHYIAVGELAIDGDYSMEFDLTRAHGDAAELIKEYMPDAVIRYDCSEAVIRYRGNNIASRELLTFNRVLERSLIPDVSYGLIAENDNVVEPARTVIREHSNNPSFELADLAKLLCISRRTLQRRLGEAGTSFIKIKQEERIHYIESKLRQGNARQILSRIAGVHDLQEIQKILEGKIH